MSHFPAQNAMTKASGASPIWSTGSDSQQTPREGNRVFLGE